MRAQPRVLQREPMPPVVVLAHAPQAEAVANRVTDELSGLGFSVDRTARVATRRAQAAKIEAAHKVVLLWSRAARGTPALRAAVRRARAKGTLVCVALDAAPPPTGAGEAKRLPRGGAAWRKALTAKPRAIDATPLRAQPRPARARRDPKLRIEKQFKATPLSRPRRRGAPVLASVLALALVAAAAGAEAYARDATFAARVNALAAQAQAKAAALTDDLAKLAQR